MSTKPVFYSFRRCPYAMRARFALIATSIEVEHREIALKNKPGTMLEASPKGTVPVLVLQNGQVIDESLDIMLWALRQHDPQHWLAEKETAQTLIAENDQVFKPWLDKYKYASRFPEFSPIYYRQQGELFLQQLEHQLQQHTFLCSEQAGLADFAIMPFIRQFAGVDKTWFETSSYPKLRRWLNTHLQSKLFAAVMYKHDIWTR